MSGTPERSDRVSDFVCVPAGTYVCRVDDVRAGVTRSGDVRWSLRLVVADGPCAGRVAAWDAIVFSVRALPRARRVFAALGVPVAGRVRVEPGGLLGRLASVDVRPAEYRSADGSTVRRNEIPYDGWRPAPAGRATP